MAAQPKRCLRRRLLRISSPNGKRDGGDGHNGNAGDVGRLERLAERTHPNAQGQSGQ